MGTRGADTTFCGTTHLSQDHDSTSSFSGKASPSGATGKVWAADAMISATVRAKRLRSCKRLPQGQRVQGFQGR